MALTHLLQSTTPRETAGSQTAGRYDFQTNFAILKLIELREAASNYRIVFDLFDDLAVLNDAQDPTKIWFYQIKSKDLGNWSSTDLCAKKGKVGPRSYIARMYVNFHQFGESVVETGFVSNAPFTLDRINGTTTSGGDHFISATQLHPGELTKFKTAIAADISSPNADEWWSKLSFIRTILGVHAQRQMVIGHLQDHIHKTSGQECAKVGALYETIHTSITARTTFSAQGLSYDEFLPRKSLTKVEIDLLVDRALARSRSLLEDWHIVTAECQAAGIGSLTQVKIKDGVVEHLYRRNMGQSSAVAFCDQIQEWLKTNSPLLDSASSLLELAKSAQAGLPDVHGYVGSKLLGACLLEVYEALGDA